MKTILSKDAPAAIGPYSQAVLHNETLYISGQLGLKAGAQELAETIQEQAMQVLKNLEIISSTSGVNFQEQAIKLTVYLTSLLDFTTVNNVMADYFQNHKPARATVEVSALPKNALIEIDAIVACKDKTVQVDST